MNASAFCLLVVGLNQWLLVVSRPFSLFSGQIYKYHFLRKVNHKFIITFSILIYHYGFLINSIGYLFTFFGYLTFTNSCFNLLYSFFFSTSLCPLRNGRKIAMFLVTLFLFIRPANKHIVHFWFCIWILGTAVISFWYGSVL